MHLQIMTPVYSNHLEVKIKQGVAHLMHSWN